LTMDLADLRGREEACHRVAAESHDHLGIDRLDLAPQIVRAGRDLLGQRITILGRAVLDYVRDENGAAVEADSAKQLVEELARGADKRSALLVFTIAWRLTDEHHLGRRASLARYAILGALTQVALLAHLDLCSDLSEHFFGCHGYSSSKYQRPCGRPSSHLFCLTGTKAATICTFAALAEVPGLHPHASSPGPSPALSLTP